MISKAEVDIILGILKSALSLIEAVDPNAAQNKVVIEIQNVINTLQAIGI